MFLMDGGWLTDAGMTKIGPNDDRHVVWVIIKYLKYLISMYYEF